jgi:hypothetical protein
MGFGAKRNQYVVQDYSRAAEFDPVVQNAILRQLLLHGLVTVLLVVALVAMLW